MNNILTAIKAIISNHANISKNAINNSVQNRANQMGDALEDYVKNAFADCVGEVDRNSVITKRSSIFSYLGNSTNPPDAMLKGGDAIEIKKLETLNTSLLQLNSSFPKNKLCSDNPKISKTCRECEKWNEKDIIYVVGQVNGSDLQNIFFVYGDVYCDSHEVYEKVEKTIKDGIKTLDSVELAETNELGRINKVDHLGISDLRVRGMWLIKTPFKQFSHLYENDKENYLFRLIAIIPESKYNSFSNKKHFEKFCKSNNVSITNEKLEDPQNPAKLINCIIIKYSL